MVPAWYGWLDPPYPKSAPPPPPPNSAPLPALPQAIAHEMGHNMNMGHAGAYDSNGNFDE